MFEAARQGLGLDAAREKGDKEASDEKPVARHDADAQQKRGARLECARARL